jgi:L-lactate dehydrogenase complex protein LldG
MQHAATASGRSQTAVDVFRTAAEKVSAVVSEVSSLEQALAYAVELCERKEACQLLMAGCEAPLSAGAEALCQLKQPKLMAAPGLDPESLETLAALCRQRGIELIHQPLRQHLAGIDIGFTVVDYGIAETGTLVLDSSSEDLRLATMVSEVHVAVLPLSKLKATALDLENELRAMMAQPPNYLAFITGASRTADIERVLALGVHGPLEVHILLWEDR